MIFMPTADYCGDLDDHHTCADGECLYRPWVDMCDGHYDCRDGSDEWGCGLNGIITKKNQ